MGYPFSPLTTPCSFSLPGLCLSSFLLLECIPLLSVGYSYLSFTWTSSLPLGKSTLIPEWSGRDVKDPVQPESVEGQGQPRPCPTLPLAGFVTWGEPPPSWAPVFPSLK